MALTRNTSPLESSVDQVNTENDPSTFLSIMAGFAVSP